MMINLEEKACSACGTCLLACPHGVLRLSKKRAHITHVERCIECGACMLNCSQGAITVTKGVGCVVTILLEDILKVHRPPGERELSAS